MRRRATEVFGRLLRSVSRNRAAASCGARTKQSRLERETAVSHSAKSRAAKSLAARRRTPYPCLLNENTGSNSARPIVPTTTPITLIKIGSIMPVAVLIDDSTSTS